MKTREIIVIRLCCLMILPGFSHLGFHFEIVALAAYLCDNASLSSVICFDVGAPSLVFAARARETKKELDVQ